jgi:germination protein M
MSKGNKASLGCLFWIAIILLAVVIFIFQNSDGKSVHFPQGTTAPQNTKKPDSPTTSPSDRQIGLVLETPSPSPTPDKKIDKNPELSNSHGSTPAPTLSPLPKKNVRNSTLYFIIRKANDEIEIRRVNRQVYHEDAPLTETMNALLKGPTSSETKSSIVSLIPKGSLIKDVVVRGSTAYISFNEDFRFNDFGVPGLKAQLKQIVYTATEFPNIGTVQILINGKKVDYLAQEGVYIGAPLSRRSF